MKLAQAEFSAKCGISSKLLNLIECAKANPELETLGKIAEYTNRSVSQLLDTDDQ